MKFNINNNKMRWLYNLLIILIVFLLLSYNTNLNCFSIKGFPEPLLKDLQYKNILFKCSENIDNNCACNALESFLVNKNNFNPNFNIVKYFKIENGLILPFNKNNCYAHPNLFFGVYNNLYFNLQFSHKIYNKNFSNFTGYNINKEPLIQYLCNQLYLYNNTLNQQFLNFNSLELNNNIAYYDKINPENAQDYLNKNKIKFNGLIEKLL